MEKYARDNGVPIMEEAGIQFLMQLIRMKRPSRILEIGAAIGYSAIRMAEAYPETKIITVERDERRYQEAAYYLDQFDLSGRIELLFGDALKLRDEIYAKGPYDLLFIDAAKGKYRTFFEQYAPAVKADGIIVTDNVLFKGWVADPTQANERMAKTAREIRRFNDWLMNHPDFHSYIVPVGDGVTISTKLDRKQGKGKEFT
ncbi:O-methyltransferase [Thalassobacillus sp. CUG 92003]|uniref:O-methyltransferase n=1 Tax=Thalassobacillus sp. CUG 92003 TaxID=2736641 RepID=UPI002102FDFD|nr:O-methyltransferase [Thalassobacillus sp. CUG 92003]